jgi:imidazoleglycerol phosphate synthase cyclase subunit
MSYTRVIPVLLFDNGAIWRSQEFSRHYRMGDPIMQLERYKAWDVDEIVYIDMHRSLNGRRLVEFLPEIARNCFAPLATGGGIRTLEDIHQHLNLGADRVVINTAAFDDPGFIAEASHRYGAQAIVVSIDARRHADGYEVVVDSGRRPTGRMVEDWAVEVATRGAGEIFINSIDRDGMGQGYDTDLVRRVTSNVHVPVIACGGVGNFDHFPGGVLQGGAGAVAASNIFAFSELSYLNAKDSMALAGVPVRASRPADLKRYAVKELNMDALLAV